MLRYMLLLCISVYLNLNVVMCRVSNEDIQGLGRWAYDSFRMSYLTTLPYKVLLVAAGFMTSVKGYLLPKSRVVPPTSLTNAVLPWVEPELRKVIAKNRVSDKANSDLSAQGFLESLIWMKTVFLHDMAVLSKTENGKTLPIMNHPVFSLPEWAPFCEEVRATIRAVADEVK